MTIVVINLTNMNVIQYNNVTSIKLNGEKTLYTIITNGTSLDYNTTDYKISILF